MRLQFLSGQGRTAWPFRMIPIAASPISSNALTVPWNPQARVQRAIWSARIEIGDDTRRAIGNKNVQTFSACQRVDTGSAA